MTRVPLYHLRNISRVRPFLSLADTENLIHAFIFGKLDYRNAVLSGVSDKTIGQTACAACTAFSFYCFLITEWFCPVLSVQHG